VCLPCALGAYSTVFGAAACPACPAGTWNGKLEQQACNVCPDGKWTDKTGALRQEDCTPCEGAGCLQDASARVTFELLRVGIQALTAQDLASIRSAYAKDIASTCGVSRLSIVDLQGGNASVTIQEDGTVTAFILSVTDSSAAELAAKLYSQTFRGLVVNSTKTVLDGRAARVAGDMAVGAVSLQPQRFTPLVPTTTATTTSTSTATRTSTRTSTTTATSAAQVSRTSGPVAKDLPSNGSVRDASDKKEQLSWWWFVVGGVVCGGAVVVCFIATKRQKRVPQASGSVV